VKAWTGVGGTMMRIGAHNSIAGGIHNAVAECVAIGGDALQIFCKNQRQWKAKPMAPLEAQAWKDALRQANLDPKASMVHGGYLINLANPDPQKHSASRQAFLDELDRTEQLGIPYLNFHPGSHLGEDKKLRDDAATRRVALDRIARTLGECIDATKGSKVKLTLENAAGQGSNVGSGWKELGHIVDAVADRHRIAVTVDTQHAWASGVDWVNDYDGAWEAFDDEVGLKWLVAFHLNDSKQPCASRVDRHDTLGEGHLGTEFFRTLVNDRRFDGLFGILETPEGPESWKREIAWLRGLRK
jgi:deoxyribonuclease IV